MDGIATVEAVGSAAVAEDVELVITVHQVADIFLEVLLHLRIQSLQVIHIDTYFEVLAVAADLLAGAVVHMVYMKHIQRTTLAAVVEAAMAMVVTVHLNQEAVVRSPQQLLHPARMAVAAEAVPWPANIQRVDHLADQVFVLLNGKGG